MTSYIQLKYCQLDSNDMNSRGKEPEIIATDDMGSRWAVVVVSVFAFFAGALSFLTLSGTQATSFFDPFSLGLSAVVGLIVGGTTWVIKLILSS